MTNTLIVTERDDRVVVQLNRPDKRNAISAEMVSELHAVCGTLEAEPRILILTGGDGMFAAGADIAEMRERRVEDALRGVTGPLLDRVARLPMPVIAAIDGPAFGAGAEMALAADFRVGTPRVRFGNPEVGLGIIAAAGATYRLQELVGLALTKEILLAGRTLTADEALAVRLLNEVYEPEALLDGAHAFADRIAKQGALAVRLTKRVMSAPRDAHPLVDELAQAILFETQEKIDRMTAFLERRQGGGKP